MHVYRLGTSTSTEHGQAVIQMQIQCWKRIEESRLSSDETFVLLISSIPRY